MRLVDFLSEYFRDGIQYEDAVQLCLAIYSSSDILPLLVQQDDLSMDKIAEAFANIAKLGLIKNYIPYKATFYGATYHAIEDKGHWIETQASIFKLNTTQDLNTVKALLGSKSSCVDNK